MICYRDMSFCSDAEACANKEGCDRWFSHEHEEKAKKWWGNDDAPVAVQSFKDTCSSYKEIQNV